MECSAVTTEPARLDQFDGLRAFAFLAVFLHHAVHAPLLWMGVDQFFVLSGFLITRNLLQLRSQASASRAIAIFYFRRLLRIVPPYYLTLALLFSIQTHPIELRDTGWFVVFASNIRDAVYGPLQGAPSTLWSIAVEEQFYLVWPALVLLLPRKRLVLAFASVVVAAIICRRLFSPMGFEAVYRLTLCRMDLLAAGALLALIDTRDSSWFHRRRTVFVTAAASSAGVFALLTVALPSFRTSNNSVAFNLAGYALSCAFFTSTLAYVRGLSSGPLYRVLTHPIARYVGKVSYMAYLVHVFALELVGRLHLGIPFTVATGLGLTLAIASASWHGIEQPLQGFRRLVS